MMDHPIRACDRIPSEVRVGGPDNFVVRVAKRQEASRTTSGRFSRCDLVERPLAAAQPGQQVVPATRRTGLLRLLCQRLLEFFQSDAD